MALQRLDSVGVLGHRVVEFVARTVGGPCLFQNVHVVSDAEVGFSTVLISLSGHLVLSRLASVARCHEVVLQMRRQLLRLFTIELFACGTVVSGTVGPVEM